MPECSYQREYPNAACPFQSHRDGSAPDNSIDEAFSVSINLLSF